MERCISLILIIRERERKDRSRSRDRDRKDKKKDRDKVLIGWYGQVTIMGVARIVTEREKIVIREMKKIKKVERKEVNTRMNTRKNHVKI